MDGDLRYRNNIQEFLKNCNLNTSLGNEVFSSVRWFKVSLKAVVLHNGNTFPSVSLAHAVYMKGKYENFQVLLQKILYQEQAWNISTDLNIIAMSIVLQGGHTNFYSLKCEWDSRMGDFHCRVKNGQSIRKQHHTNGMWHILL